MRKVNINIKCINIIGYADASKALKEMGWKANLDIVDACHDSWNWQKNNPKGYDND